MWVPRGKKQVSYLIFSSIKIGDMFKGEWMICVFFKKIKCVWLYHKWTFAIRCSRNQNSFFPSCDILAFFFFLPYSLTCGFSRKPQGWCDGCLQLSAICSPTASPHTPGLILSVGESKQWPEEAVRHGCTGARPRCGEWRIPECTLWGNRLALNLVCFLKPLRSSQSPSCSLCHQIGQGQECWHSVSCSEVL